MITCDADYLRSNRPKKIIKYYGKRRKYHLTRSFIANNYLTDEETIRLCKKSELTKEQLQTWFCHKRDELKSGKMLDDPGSEPPSTDEDKPGRGYRPRSWYTSGKARIGTLNKLNRLDLWNLGVLQSYHYFYMCFIDVFTTSRL